MRNFKGMTDQEINDQIPSMSPEDEVEAIIELCRRFGCPAHNVPPGNLCRTCQDEEAAELITH